MAFEFPADVRDKETPFARLPRDAHPAAIGVRKPIISAVPTRISSDPIAKADRCVCDPISVLAPRTIALSAAVARMRTRPTPGHPSGKVEKSFCSQCLLGHASAPDLKASFFDSGINP